MQILAIEQNIPGADVEQMQSRLAAEARAAWQLKMEGALREIWFTEDHRAVLLLECADQAAALQALSSMPLFRDGLIGFEVTPLLPYDGFARLFEKKPEL